MCVCVCVCVRVCMCVHAYVHVSRVFVCKEESVLSLNEVIQK